MKVTNEQNKERAAVAWRRQTEVVVTLVHYVPTHRPLPYYTGLSHFTVHFSASPFGRTSYTLPFSLLAHLPPLVLSRFSLHGASWIGYCCSVVQFWEDSPARLHFLTIFIVVFSLLPSLCIFSRHLPTWEEASYSQ